MSKNSENVKTWRRNCKTRIVEAMGGKCQCCGYFKCNSALEMHHIEPDKKDISFGDIMKNPRKWDEIKIELSKCILLCCRCHREYHANILELPKTFEVFDENKIKTKLKNSKCIICKKETSYMNKTCSSSCAARLTNNVDWSLINLKEELKTQTIMDIANKYDVSDMAVRKRLKTLKIDIKKIQNQFLNVHKKEFLKSCIDRRKVERPTKEILEKLIIEKPFTEIGKLYNVSDNSIRKWCKYYNIIKPVREKGYWQKLKFSKKSSKSQT